MKSDLAKWIEEDSKEFLKKIGIRKGYAVLDFGCGRGHYTIPVSKVVGNIGVVYALDKNKSALSELKKIIAKEDIKNVKLINDIKDPSLGDKSVDVVLCYDVIHLVGKEDSSTVKDRMKLYEIIRRFAKKNALFSVYPTHLVTHTDITSNRETKKEIEKAGFIFEREIYAELIHDDKRIKGCILNFRKGG